MWRTCPRASASPHGLAGHRNEKLRRQDAAVEAEVRGGGDEPLLEPIDLDLLHLKLASEVVERGLICAPYAPRHQRLWLHRLDRLLYPDVRGRIVLPRR
jgi:hypothetical protein